jgi:hypothetical protein
MRLQCGQVSWVSSCFDLGRVFAETFGIAGVLRDGAQLSTMRSDTGPSAVTAGTSITHAC